MQKINFILPFLLICLYANAQKLPNIQTASLRAPANIKIDGKADEWNNQFQAYNKATDVFYTVANDDKKLYLIIQATDKDIIRKIMLGRVIFTINPLAKKTDDKSISVSYPVFSRTNRPGINLKDAPQIIDGNKSSVAQADSFMNVSNKRFAEKSKFIKVSGISDVDSLISVYNTDGIKASAAFNNKMFYTYELSVDLKLLSQSIKDNVKFNYNVRLMGLTLEDVPGVTITRSDNGTILAIDINRSSSYSPSASNETDFWGEYTLANNRSSLLSLKSFIP